MRTARISATTQSQKFGPILIPKPRIFLSDIDTQSQNFEGVTKTIQCQMDKGSRAGNDNFCPKWPLKRSSDLSTFFEHKKYLKSVHLKVTTCCLENCPVVLSFSTHYHNFEYNSKPQSQKSPSESVPQSQKFSIKSISQSQNFQAKNYPKLAHIPVLPHSEVPPPGTVEKQSVFCLNVLEDTHINTFSQKKFFLDITAKLQKHF